MSMGKKREQASFTLDLKVLSVGHHLDRVNRFAGQAVGRAQNLDGTNEIKFLNRGHGQDDDASLLVQDALPTRVAVGRGHVPGLTTNYATPNALVPSVNLTFGENRLNPGAKGRPAIRIIPYV